MDEIKRKWQELFHTDRTFNDGLIMALTGKYAVDVMKLDDWLHAQGYREEAHGSMADYITERYGPEAAKFVSDNI